MLRRFWRYCRFRGMGRPGVQGTLTIVLCRERSELVGVQGTPTIMPWRERSELVGVQGTPTI